MKPRITRIIFIIAIVAIGALLVLAPDRAEQEVAEGDGTEWTCSMHPQVRQPQPGDCPLCGMDLIPVEQTDGGEREFSVSEEAKALIEIEVQTVVRRTPDVELRLVGRILADERKVSRITAWVAGRIEKLHVGFTGQTVESGDPMAEFYSPELLSAQQELIGAPSDAMRDAAVRKLELWGVTEEQIAAVESRGSAESVMTILAPVGGTVVEKSAIEGAHLMRGAPLFTIADLSTVWLALDAYESDLGWLAEGQPLQFTVDAYPGEEFEGSISFIDPVVSVSTRTVSLRADVPNESGKLKPGMLARATVHVSGASGMGHQGMAPGHSGYAMATATDDDSPPLLVPASAPLITGRRAIVYVEVEGADLPTYEGREITLGQRAGDYYIVLDGLMEGERVVTNGNFKIDSELQIQAKPSMMSPEGGAKPAGHDH